jgi:PAS domain S-box-containing protein
MTERPRGGLFPYCPALSVFAFSAVFAAFAVFAVFARSPLELMVGPGDRYRTRAESPPVAVRFEAVVLEDEAAPDPVTARVLLVDDLPSNLLALEAVLQSSGYDVVSVRSGAEALACLAEAEFAVVLLDVQMPTMDGFQTAARVQQLAHESARRVPIIFVTAIDSDRARVASGYAHGAVDFLQKPFDPDALRAKVSTFVELFRVKQRLAVERELARRRAAASEARLQALTELALGLSQARTRSRVAEVIVEHGMRLAGADTCTLYLLDKKGEALDLLGDRGVAPDILAKVRRITSESSNAATLDSVRTGASIWAENLAEYEAIFPALANLKSSEKRAHAFWSLPLVVDGRGMGLLAMGFYAARTFSPAERTFVRTFGEHCAQGLQRALLLEREDETRRWFSTTLQSIGDAVIATDPQGRVTFMNPVAERMTGWTEPEALGQRMEDVFQIFSEATGEAVESPVEKVLREGTVVGLANHTVLRSRSGVELPIDDSGAPIRDQDGNLFGVVLVFRDVTVETRAEKRRAFLALAADTLISSLDYRQTLAAVARLAVPELADWCTVNIVEAGESTPRQLAVAHTDPAKVAYARELGERYPPDRNAPTGAPQVIRSGKSELYPEIPAALLEAGAKDEEHLRMIRELRLESAMIVPFPARDGRTLGAMTFIYAASGRRYAEEDLAFAEDFAKRAGMAIENAQALKEADAARARERAMRKEAELANTTKDEFLATVSHELRTPLNAVLGWTVTLRRRNFPADTDRALEVIERNARAQSRLIDDVLDVSRITSGKLTLKLGPVDIGESVQVAVEAIRPAAEAKGIALTMDAPAGPPMTIFADADRLQQILWNLLTNAVKFTPKGGAIEVRARRTGLEVAVEVVDTGEGIRPDVLPYVFDPFRQADSSTTRRHGGLGLGLALVKQLAAAHGGVVQVNSAGAGRGATFVVTLPARALTAAVAVPPRPKPTRAGEEEVTVPRAELEGVNVLVVDDEDDARELVGETFRSAGATVHLASSVAQALGLLESARPDVIVSDIGMPSEDGYSLLRNVRARAANGGGGTPAIALTAYSRAEDADRAVAAGFQRHLAKPVGPAELIRLAAALVGRHAMGV